jgi:hypothetical protein
MTLVVSAAKAEEPCKGPMERDDTLGKIDCCAGVAIPGSTESENPDDYVA